VFSVGTFYMHDERLTKVGRELGTQSAVYPTFVTDNAVIPTIQDAITCTTSGAGP